STGDGSLVEDVSTDGFNPDPVVPGDFSPNEPTPVTLSKGDIYIPEGFSPNNDGINDYFVIENAAGKRVDLEIYNRWGNVVYKSTDYQNNWAGKCTEGICLGEDLPVGTYYYIVKIDNQKKVGFITINR
ncbi:gliding motility-associated C-terminal domain-containing protein, partial [Pseudoxanthomonas sp. SGD-10]